MEGDKTAAKRNNPKCLRLEIKREHIFEDGVPTRHVSFVNHVKRRTKDDLATPTVITRQIGILGGGALVLQTVIGPGIFTSPKGVAEFGGSIGVSYIVWILSGLFSTLAALCFVELQLSVPRAGCEYGYIHKAFGKLPTFIYTWTRIALAEPATTAVFCIAFADYVADGIHDKCGPPESNRKLLAIFAVVTLTLLNGAVKNVANAINIASNCGKVLALTVIIAGGVYNICRNQERAIKGGFDFSKTSYHSTCLAFYNSLWAYGGWANVPHVTTGVKQPPKILPKLILTVIPFVTLLYLVTVTSFFTVLTRDELIGAEAIGVIMHFNTFRFDNRIPLKSVLGDEWGEEMYAPLGYVIPVFVCLIAFGNANGTFMQAGRTASVAVHDGYIPELLSYVHVHTNIHVPAVAARCVATIVLVCFIDVGVLVRFYVFTVWLFHGLTVLGLLVLRYKRRTSYDRQFEVPLIVPIMVLMFSIAIVAGPFTVWPPMSEFVFSIGVLLVSIALFVPFGKAKSLASMFDRFSIFLQLLMNVIPPRIQRHRKKDINLRRRSVFSPTSTQSAKSLDVPETPGTFRSSSAEVHQGEFKWPKQPSHNRQDILNRATQHNDTHLHSVLSANYCDVMTRFDEASEEDPMDRTSCDVKTRFDEASEEDRMERMSCDVMTRFDVAPEEDCMERKSLDSSCDEAYSSGYHTPSITTHSRPGTPTIGRSGYQGDDECTKF